MNKKLILLTTGLFLAAMLLVFSCRKEAKIKSAPADKAFFVTEAVARQFAERLPEDILGETHVASRATDDDFVGLTHTVKDSYTLTDVNGLPALYIFNFGNDSGFVVMSADFRYEPVCAYVDHGGIQPDTVPGMLVNWFETTIENIEILRDGRYDNTDNGYRAWAMLAERTNLFSKLPLAVSGLGELAEVDCGQWNNYDVAPMLPCKWGQSCSYNELCPDRACGNVNLACPWNTKALTGCVPTAIAQLMRYWQYPSGYAYGTMPDTFGNAEVQRLMRDIGQKTGTVYSNCTESATPITNILPALKDSFGFSTGAFISRYDNSIKWMVKLYLDHGMPVLFGGCTVETVTTSWFGLFTTVSNDGCHVWVADGYRMGKDNCFTRLWLNLNWGWKEKGYGQDYVGLYSFDYWQVGNRNYQYAHDVLLNIHP